MKYARSLAAILMLAALVGCTTVYTSTVTVTKVADTTMKAWADLKVHGHTTVAIDDAVTAAHARYRQACGVAEKALEQYKASGDPGSFNAAFAAVQSAVLDLINIIQPLLDPAQTMTLKAEVVNAKQL